MDPHGSKAVFLSYASQDADQAGRICEALRTAGIEVWFDRSELRGGDVWDAKIRTQVRECALFVAIISANSNSRLEGYFRREWNLAVDRTRDMAEEKPFLVPVVIDETSETGASVPEKFRAVQWTRLPDGVTPPAFAHRVQTLLTEGSRSPLATRTGLATEDAAPSPRGPGPRHHAPRPRPRPLRLAVLVTLLLVAIGGVAMSFGPHLLRERHARQVTIPEIEKLATAREYWPAFRLARQARAILGDDPLLLRVVRDVTCNLSLTVRPDGTQIFVRPTNGGDSKWVHLGSATGAPLLIPRGYFALKLEHPKAETYMVAWEVSVPEIKFTMGLIAKGKQPPGMVFVPRRGILRLLNYSGVQPRWPASVGPPFAPFWMDVHEVTNREFKTFVDAGGYRRPELWLHPMVKEGRIMPWAEAMAEFHDTNGRPGPAGWELGTYPDSRAEYPVTGVSWHEAAAYAEFVGKRLPTVYHWDAAADIGATGFFLPGSNFSGRLAPVGSYRGSLNRNGLYDMAGNAREWCFNASGERRFTLGEAFDSGSHYFSTLIPRSPFDRSSGNGFRCMKLSGENDTLAADLDAPLDPLPASQLQPPEPFSDAEWQDWLTWLAYPEIPLTARTDLVDDKPPSWRLEKVSFTAAYGNERMQAYLFLPKNGSRPPFQTILFWPGAGVFAYKDSDNGRSLPNARYFHHLVKDGRAVLYPILKDTFERGTGAAFEFAKVDVDFATKTALHVMRAQDISRSIDYLKSRSDIAGDRIGFLGYSWGGMMGSLPCAHERERIKAGILIGGSMKFPVIAGWAKRVTIPMLMLSGQFDYMGHERTQVPLFQTFATPAKDKRHVVYPTDHDLSGFEKEIITESLRWFDTYLGPVRR